MSSFGHITVLAWLVIFFIDSGYSVPGKRNQGKEVFGVNFSVYPVRSKVIYYLLLAGAIGVRRF